jgi:hypothetical protein
MTDYSRFLNQVEDLLITEALQPWQDQAQETWLPWAANEELKGRWIAMIVSGKDYCTRVAGFLALARVACLGASEEQLLGEFYRGYEFKCGNLNLFVDYVLTGASPPPALWQGYFLKVLQKEEPPPPHFWEQFSAFMRHPGFHRVLEQLATVRLSALALGMLLLNNPMIGALRSRFLKDLANPWIAAAFVSTLRASEVLALDLDEQLVGLAAFLRTDYSVREFRDLRLKSNLNEAFSLIEVEHPCRELGACEVFDQTNPHANAIIYHGCGGRVAGLLKYRNPLLNYPWITESALRLKCKGDVFFALCLLGLPPFEYQHLTGNALRFFTDLLAEHPMGPLADRYEQGAVLTLADRCPSMLIPG